ncbi:aldehyde dehydrogenase family protein [Streptomyces sp. NPDC058579]|uniref:aldehyde dehydrogenase family protein n=1 Tax=Streptomyces sp. NPDC058579 TaxID=3346548 RepID=UPI0036515372
MATTHEQSRLSGATDDDVPHHRMFIDGAWVDTDEHTEIHSPANESLLATVAKAGRKETDAAVAAAKRAFESRVWADMPVVERADLMQTVADRLQARFTELTELQSREIGVPITVAELLHIGLTISELRDIAELGRDYAWQEEAPVIGDNALGGYLRKEPVGVVAAIVPWNVPMQLGMNKIAPALIAGNSVVVKPDSHAPLTLLELAREFDAAGLPKGVFNVVTGPGEVVGSRLSEHPDVRKIAFTGSTAVGRDVMSRASANVKKVSLELVGKGPNIVLPDADVDHTVDGALFSFLSFSGQGCESGTRLLLPSSLHDEFVARMVERIKTLRIGDPSDRETTFGPVISRRQRDRILGYIASGLEQGATLATGGHVITGPGFERGHWIEPTIFTDVTNDMRIAQEEIFGPVVAVIRYDTIEEAIAIANDTEYGLSAGVWGEDLERAMDVANRIDAGMVWINDFHVVDARYPFGGMKQSGLGRELGPNALDEYTEVKHVAYATGRRNDPHPYAVLFGNR